MLPFYRLSSHNKFMLPKIIKLHKGIPNDASTAPPNNRSSILGFLIQFVAIAIVFFAIGFTLGQRKIDYSKKSFIPRITFTNQLPPKEQQVDFSLFWEVMKVLPEKYLDKSAIDGQKVLYGAISGMVRSLGDPYTAFLDPKQNEAIRSELSGTYEGVGIQIGFNKQNRLVVIAPLSKSPAEREGLKAKDLILKIGDKETFDLTLPEAVDLIRGPSGSRVKLLLQHEGESEPYEKEITRARIEVKSVEVKYQQGESGEIAIIKVTRFGDKTDGEWDAAVSEVLTKQIKGIIVDMRNNPGGLLSSSIHLASEFTRGTIVKQEFSDGSQTSMSADHQGKLLKTPLVVVVNDGSASAAEIFAGAIQDSRRGEIIGTKTFGKGTVQDVVDLPQGAGLHITIAKWLTPKGNSIHGNGITPDIIVELTDSDIEGEKDPQIEKAMEFLNGK